VSKISIDRLTKKYGSDNIKGEKYQKIVNDILSFNREKITNSVVKITDDKFKKTIASNKWRVDFPPIEDITKKRLLFIDMKPQTELLKTAEKGNYITQTLRNKLSNDLKETLKRVPAGTKLSQRLVKEYKARITDTFSNYTKKDPRYGVPSNIRNISVTEMKSAVNNTRKIYMDELIARNPELEYYKQWFHYKSYSKEYRRGHAEKHLEKKKMGEKFTVNIYEKKKGKWVKSGKTVEMDRPHDSNVDISEIIGCSCELKYILRKNS